jgi:hypothetical protein
MSTYTDELQKEIAQFDPRTPHQNRSPEERQLAMDAFLKSVHNTDEATNAEISDALDQMLERIYSDRTPPQTYRNSDRESDAA